MSEIKPVAYFRATKKRGIIWSEDCCCADPIFDDAYDDGYDGEDDETFSLPVYSSAAYESLQKDLGLAKLALESKRDLLKSCESALEQSQADNAALQKENERLDFKFKHYWGRIRKVLQRHRERDAAQAKRISKLEQKDEMLDDMCELLKINKENWFSLYSVVAELK